MKPIYEFFVSPKYQKIRDSIFHVFTFAILVTGLLFYFTGISTPGIIVAAVFVIYEIPHTIFNSYKTWKSAKNKHNGSKTIQD